MNATTEKRTFRERHPECYPTPEEWKKRCERLLALFKSPLFNDDIDEQKETGEFFMKALAEARESNREPEQKQRRERMSTLTHEKTFYERHPELVRTPEERKRRYARLLKKFKSPLFTDTVEEQKETGEFLMKALAEARESNREPDRE